MGQKDFDHSQNDHTTGQTEKSTVRILKLHLPYFNVEIPKKRNIVVLFWLTVLGQLFCYSNCYEFLILMTNNQVRNSPLALKKR